MDPHPNVTNNKKYQSTDDQPSDDEGDIFITFL